ncbi:hypothetical protein ACS0TY_035982 [Phlomoides rotata]
MEKRKWPWKRKSCESESSESVSSHSGRYSDEQESLKESPNDNSQTAEATTISDDEMKESVRVLTEKLSAALANVSAKEDLVKQHAKVAEEAVAGWEKAESEGAALKKQLEVAVQQNVSLEVKTSHLDSALKECVRQLRRARDEQDKRICDAIVEKSNEWESARAEKFVSTDPNTILILEALEKENLFLKQELVSRCRELEVVTIARDLSTQAVETASKLQLESIKKVAKLEGECRRLQSMARKSSPLSESSREAFNKPSTKNLAVEIDMMDDFLEMERLAALPESSNAPSGESVPVDNALRAELDTMIQRVADLDNMLEKMEAEKQELQNALDVTLDSLWKAESRIAEGESMLEEVLKELRAITETKESLEFQLVQKEEESRTIAANVDSLKADIQRERKSSKELTIKCRDLENELTRKIQETELEQSMNSNSELKIKQEDLAVAADKLEECQKTIASLGRQLQSLATLEDFLIDTSNIPELSRESSNSDTGELWRVPDNDSSRSSSSSPSSTNHGTTAKSRNSFGKFFC